MSIFRLKGKGLAAAAQIVEALVQNLSGSARQDGKFLQRFCQLGHGEAVGLFFAKLLGAVEGQTKEEEFK